MPQGRLVGEVVGRVGAETINRAAAHRLGQARRQTDRQENKTENVNEIERDRGRRIEPAPQQLADRRAIDRFARVAQPDEVETAEGGKRGQIADDEGSQSGYPFVASIYCYEPKASGDHGTSDLGLL